MIYFLRLIKISRLEHNYWLKELDRIFFSDVCPDFPERENKQEVTRGKLCQHFLAFPNFTKLLGFPWNNLNSLTLFCFFNLNALEEEFMYVFDRSFKWCFCYVPFYSQVNIRKLTTKIQGTHQEIYENYLYHNLVFLFPVITFQTSVKRCSCQSLQKLRIGSTLFEKRNNTNTVSSALT